ncbi:hypothetical protein CPC08DRAFT_606412, partial [Agrocybe pediades]
MNFCADCGHHFWGNWWNHVEDSNSPYHNPCLDCREDFATWVGLKEHWVQSPNHDYCQYCDEHFNDDYDLEVHNHQCHPFCSRCNKVFKNDHGLSEHRRQSPNHHFCLPCGREFSSANSLEQHLMSSIHREKNVKCPGCDSKFVSHSAMVLHCENGGCRSGVNRNMVNGLVRQYDTGHAITDPSRMIGNGSEEITTYLASEASWNGYKYECYLCHGEFSDLKALNQHLASPKHQQKIYICRGPSCGIQFAALSGLMQHMESQRCDVTK